MRAPASPFRNPTPLEGISQDLISTNSGNLVFPAAVTRALMREGVEFEYIQCAKKLSDEDVDRYNAECGSFVLPLANAFRSDNWGIEKLNVMTNTVKRLKMPCIIDGVGIQVGLKEEIDKERPFDEASRKLIREVLKKSAMVGVRGEITARYMKHLGFQEEKDFTVIGCPSMYYYGPSLPEQKELKLSRESRINLNGKILLPQKFQDYLFGICDLIPDHWYIPQNLYELKTIYEGMPIRLRGPGGNWKIPRGYPADYTHPLYRENRVRGFVSLKPWMDFLALGDLSFGSRIHGNITAILSGLPALIVANDTRVLELAAYHRIQHISLKELDPKASIFELCAKADFGSIYDGHEARFSHYLDFLHKNGLRTIFDDGEDEIAGTGPYAYEGRKPENCPYDRQIASIDFHGTVIPFPFLSEEERMDAFQCWGKEVEKCDRKLQEYRDKMERMQATIDEQNRKLRKLRALRHPIQTIRRKLDI